MTKLMNVRLIVMCIICLFCYSCENEQLEDTYTKPHSLHEVKFSLAAPGTSKLKSTDSYFEVGDRIGIYAVESVEGEAGSLSESGNYAHNMEFIFNGSTLEAASEENKIFFPAGKVLEFYAYYPFNKDLDNPHFLYHEVSAYQDNLHEYMLSDFLIARNVTGKSNETIYLLFEHKNALVEFNFNIGIKSHVIGVKLLNAKMISIFNLMNGDTTIVKDLERKDVSMHLWDSWLGQTLRYRALIPSQSIKKDEFLFEIKLDEGIQKYKALEDINLHLGSKNIFNFTLQYKIETFVTGRGDVSGGGTFEYGQNVQLIATPFSGYRFEGWFEDGLPVWEHEVYSFNVESDRKLEARFSDEHYYKVVVFTTQGGTVYTLNGDRYKHGEICTFVAEPYTWWEFVGWYYKNSNQIAFPNRIFELPVTSDMELEARFRYLHPSK